MLAVNDRRTAYKAVQPPKPVEVYVEGEASTGWFIGQLREWTHYEGHRWTAVVQYSIAPAEQYIGRFLAEHVRELDDARSSRRYARGL